MEVHKINKVRQSRSEDLTKYFSGCLAHYDVKLEEDDLRKKSLVWCVKFINSAAYSGMNISLFVFNAQQDRPESALSDHDNELN